jgi:hypothetical protein
MSRIILAIFATLCILLAVLTVTVAYLGILESRDISEHRARSFQGSLAKESWASLRDGALFIADRLRSDAAAISDRLRAAFDSASGRIRLSVGWITTAIDRLRGPDTLSRLVTARRSAGKPSTGSGLEATAPAGPVSAGGPEVKVQAPAKGSLAYQELVGDTIARTQPVLRVKTPEERRVEELLEKAFLKYFREYTITGRRMTLRMPFALNDEREGGPGYKQVFYREGKGTPEELWPFIDKVLASRQFRRYAGDITSPGEKAVVFNLARRSYGVSRNRQLIEALGIDSYPGTPTRIFVRRSEAVLTEADLYNYLYAVATVGVDCSGFSYHVQEEVAQAYGVDLNRLLAKDLRTSPREVRAKVGLRFFDPASGHTEVVGDRIVNLRPGDLILFRGSDGNLKHSAVIQSVDLEEGIIRYTQSTDWAPEEERGVHLSLIRFDPKHAGESLRHYSVRWLQQVRPPFAGEEEPQDWQTDADRYLWYTAAGGSLVVRPRYLSSLFLAAEPRFFTNISAEGEIEETGEATAGGPLAVPAHEPPVIPPRRIAR